MSAEIIRTYIQEVPALRFIGKKYGDNDRINGNYGKYWGDWHSNGWFDEIINHSGKDIKTIYEDGDAYIGLMRHYEGQFEYWIGIFMPERANVPTGFDYLDFSKATLGVCWLHGKENDVFFHEEECSKKLEQAGHKLDDICLERYACPRFTTPDENGKVILDICFYLK